jgi:hypothetical protein
MGDLNTLLSLMERTCRQKDNKDILELNNTMNEMDLRDIYSIFSLMAAAHRLSKQPMEFSLK